MKHRVVLFFSDTAKPEVDSKPLKRISQMIRRERLPLTGEHFERTPCTAVICPDIYQESPDSREIDLKSDDIRYFATFELSDPKKLNALVGLLRSFAEYCGIYSRVWSWEAL